MEFITNNWSEILLLVLTLLKGAEIVTRWTTTPKDDEIVAKIKAVVSGVVSTTSKTKP